ncbi:MAG TPA: lactate racemase domain-containing protein [Pirellulales bacterium]|nr:lactate racemase domain-containing protein [Pirellulales bacterium]
MTASIRYGTDASVELALPADRLIASCGTTKQPVLADVRTATAQALADPIGFPPLAQAVVPGDRVVLALDHDVPRGREIVSALFDCLVERGVQPADIHLLTTGADLSARNILPAAYRDQATVSTHDPDARDGLSYLAVGADDEPIYLNRLLCDADVVVPIGCLRCEPAIDYHGMFGGLFPTFSGRQTQDKLFARGIAHAARDEARCREKIQEVGWLLGVQFTVQVVPGPGGEVLQVLAGMPGDVFRQGQSACQRAWSCAVPRTAQLVIAAIDGPPSEQTWDNVARALATAQRVVAAGGAIALCTSLDESPGPNVQQVAELKDLRLALRVFGKRRASDSLPAVALVQALSESRVYLMSQLDESTVEELGVTPVASPAELTRLADRHASCILISHAQYAVATVGSE